FAIVSVAAAQIGKALQLKDRVPGPRPQAHGSTKRRSRLAVVVKPRVHTVCRVFWILPPSPIGVLVWKGRVDCSITRYDAGIHGQKVSDSQEGTETRDTVQSGAGPGAPRPADGASGRRPAHRRDRRGGGRRVTR